MMAVSSKFPHTGASWQSSTDRREWAASVTLQAIHEILGLHTTLYLILAPIVHLKMALKNRSDVVVLDSGPIIKNEPAASTLLASASTLVTSSLVLSEIKDVKTRSRVDAQLLPFLEQRIPNRESLRFVSEFAQKTGDYSLLSRTDLEILALTYEIECEKNGSSHLRNVPGSRPLKPPCPQPDNSIQAGSISKADSPPHSVSQPAEDSTTPLEPELSESRQQAEDEVSEEFGRLDLENVHPDGLKEPHGSEQETLTTQNSTNSEIVESDSEGSEGWITPSNMKKHQARDSLGLTFSSSQPDSMRVACITTDFAMQNVLLQIGLNLLSPSFQRIRNIRTHILRCHACFQQVKDTSRQFCPRCGNPTLTRVSCSTNQKGEFRIHLKKKMEWHHRGDRYSIPKPVHGSASGKPIKSKGGGVGGWGQSLILAEDQKEYQRAMKGSEAGKIRDLMDDDYLPSILTGKRDKSRSRPRVGGGKNVNALKRTR